MSEPDARAEYVAIGLASAAVLLFETLVTRVLSVTVQYHFAFLAISLAMLGLGAPGVWYSIWPPGARAVRVSLLAAAVAMPASILAIVKLGAIWRGSITLIIFALLAPLLALGSAVCALLVRARGVRVARVYAADFLGAALGAVAVIPLMQGIPTPPLIAALAILPLSAAVVLAPRDRKVLLVSGAIASVILALLVSQRPFRLRYTKFQEETVEPLYEKWTPTARVAVFPQGAEGGSELGGDFYGWGMGSRFVAPKPDGLWLDQDGSAGTPILHWSRGTPVPPFLAYDVTSVAYQLGRPLDRVAIVGGGGGRDILTAAGMGARAIDVIELNSYIAGAVRNEFASYSGDPYGLPGVHTTIGEGRSVLTASDARYDVIQISLIDTFTATAAGAYALSENGLYTVEAFQLYLRRLSPTGVLSVTRWIDGPSLLEAPRLVLVARQALADEGVEDPLMHLIVMRGGATANVMVFRAPVDAELLASADRVARARGLLRLWPPTPETKESVVAAVLIAGPEFFARSGFDVTPTTDDRPFFFQTIDLLAPPPPEVRDRLTSNDPALLLRRIVLVLAGITGALFSSPSRCADAGRRATGSDEGPPTSGSSAPGSCSSRSRPSSASRSTSATPAAGPRSSWGAPPWRRPRLGRRRQAPAEEDPHDARRRAARRARREPGPRPARHRDPRLSPPAARRPSPRAPPAARVRDGRAVPGRNAPLRRRRQELALGRQRSLVRPRERRRAGRRDGHGAHHHDGRRRARVPRGRARCGGHRSRRRRRWCPRRTRPGPRPTRVLVGMA